MQPYQEEYISNCREYNSLTVKKLPEDTSLEAYIRRLEGIRGRKRELVRRNMELLRGTLLPTLDHLGEADKATLDELEEFTGQLLRGNDGLDVELFCLIRRWLLGLARQRNDRKGIIRESYWLGIGRHAVYNKVSGLADANSWSYMGRMRLPFVEAAAYLKYFDDIEDLDTRSYIMRSVANSGLGRFPTVAERTRLLKRSLRIFQDPYYRTKEPGLPWDRFVFMTHQLMVSSLDHGGERGMTAQDVADIMESVHIVNHNMIEKAVKQNKPLPASQVFRTAAVEYFCGIHDLNRLLTLIESLMDHGDPDSFSTEDMYRLISLPAFYCLYLENNPSYIPPREAYLVGLFRRLVDYMDSFPEDREDETLFLYLRQVSVTYPEVKGGISYGEFLSRMVSRFAPSVYVHSVQVARVAKTLCGIIMDEEPGFFDDIDFIRDIADPAEKRRAVLDFAMNCGRFHDVGKVNFLDLYSHVARQWMEQENDMARLHVLYGENALRKRASTRRYAVAALGHHAWYDGSRGYPEQYKRLEHPERQIVDVIALADWLVEVTDTEELRRGEVKTFQEAVEAAIQLEGKRFSPMLTVRLRDAAVAKQLEEALELGRMSVYRALYEKGEEDSE